MQPMTHIELTDVSDSPKAKMLLPATLRVGDKLQLDFKLSRQHGGRHEVLEVSGEYRVSKAFTDATEVPPRPCIQVESTGKSPAWRAIKKPYSGVRKLPPARSPRTLVES